jgi:Cu(I)/Ag(I) efflux system protein CusF
MTAATTAKTGKGTGAIKAIDPVAGTVTIRHGPIPAVGWPAMTRTFKAKPVALLSGRKVGENISFDARVMGASAEVTAVGPNLTAWSRRGTGLNPRRPGGLADASTGRTSPAAQWAQPRKVKNGRLK